ncbi:hypothetical protein Tco_0103287 [Tanacetum coccineum]
MKVVRSSSYVLIVPSLSSSSHVFASSYLQGINECVYVVRVFFGSFHRIGFPLTRCHVVTLIAYSVELFFRNSDYKTRSQSDNIVSSPHGFIVYWIIISKNIKKVTEIVDVKNWQRSSNGSNKFINSQHVLQSNERIVWVSLPENDEDEDLKEDEFKEEEDPQEEEDDMEVDIEQDEDEPELTYPYEEVDPLNPLPPVSESEPDDEIKVKNLNEHEDETVPVRVYEVDLGNEVRSSMEQGTVAMEKLVEKPGNTEDRVECKKLKKELEEARSVLTDPEDQAKMEMETPRSSGVNSPPNAHT